MRVCKSQHIRFFSTLAKQRQEIYLDSDLFDGDVWGRAVVRLYVLIICITYSVWVDYLSVVTLWMCIAMVTIASYIVH